MTPQVKRTALFNIGFGIVLVLVVLYLIGVVGGSTISITFFAVSLIITYLIPRIVTGLKQRKAKKEVNQ